MRVEPRTVIERKVVIVRMPVDKRQWLERRAAETGMSMSALLMQALEDAMHKDRRRTAAERRG